MRPQLKVQSRDQAKPTRDRVKPESLAALSLVDALSHTVWKVLLLYHVTTGGAY